MSVRALLDAKGEDEGLRLVGAIQDTFRGPLGEQVLEYLGEICSFRQPLIPYPNDPDGHLPPEMAMLRREGARNVFLHLVEILEWSFQDAIANKERDDDGRNRSGGDGAGERPGHAAGSGSDWGYGDDPDADQVD